MKKLEKAYILKRLIITVFLLLPFAMALSTIISGNIDFGYDPARDFLLALNNLQRLTLIGPTSGIPGIFYGPYWIWLISFGLLFSHNPCIVVFLILTLPYFTIFPYLLFKFKKVLGLTTCAILWTLFIFSTGIKYATSPWNPHPAPLLFLVLIYLITFTNFSIPGYGKYFRVLFVGIISGLILNFHISFGLGISVGTALFFTVFFVKEVLSNKKKIKKLFSNYVFKTVAFGTGIFLTFLPFFIFEARHGFNQLQVAINTLSSRGAVVGVIGLSKGTILQSFFGKIGELLKIPQALAIILFVFSIVYFVYKILNKKIKFQENEIRLLLLLISICVSVLSLYLTSKNPVWSYHFIGVEIIFIFFIGLIISKIRILEIALGIWILLTLALNVSGIINSFHQNPYVNSSSLATEEYIVKTIIGDSNKTNYNVFVYSSSIYSYQYSYLFKWLDNRDFSYDPGLSHLDTGLVYLIIPPATKEVQQNFINYRTPPKKYSPLKQWHLQDGTMIVKKQVRS